MTGIELARKIVDQKSAHVFRPRGDGTYDAKPWGSGNKRGWVILDLFSASGIVNLYEALNDTNKAKFAAMPIEKALVVMYRLANKK